MAKQLGLDQGRRHRGAVDRHEGSLPSLADGMEHARRHLLARAALPHQQNRRRAGRDGADLLAQVHHGRRTALDHLIGVLGRELGACLGQLTQELPAFVDAVDDGQHLGQLEGFGHVVNRGLLDRSHRFLDGPERGHQHDMGVGAFVAQAAQNSESVHLGQPNIAHHQMEGLTIEAVHGLAAIGGKRDAVAKLTQSLAERQANVGLVVYEQDIQHGRPAVSTRNARADSETRSREKQAPRARLDWCTACIRGSAELSCRKSATLRRARAVKILSSCEVTRGGSAHRARPYALADLEDKRGTRFDLVALVAPDVTQR